VSVSTERKSTTVTPILASNRGRRDAGERQLRQQRAGESLIRGVSKNHRLLGASQEKRLTIVSTDVECDSST